VPKQLRPSPGVRPALTSYLGVLVFLTGGTILVLEIVGARLLSPVFGSSLYVWSALITVTLLALAALDERRFRPAVLAGVIAAALGAFACTWRDAPRSKVLFTTETFYGELAVVDAYPLRYLMLDGIPQSLWNAATQDNAAPYPMALEMAPLMAGGDRALVIGIGAGVLPVNLERYYGMTADSVDVNAAVADAARQYFDFKTRGRTYVEDGRTFVRRAAAETYDVIFVDAFNGDTMPYHPMTREFLSEARLLLRPSGVIAINAVGRFGSPEGLSGDVRSIAATLRAAFPHVRAFRLPPLGGGSVKGPEIQNVLLFAGQRPLAARPYETWRPDARPILERMTGAELGDEATAGGIVLSDDYNPIDFLNAETAQEMRRQWGRHRT
jgi:spermidine synthase